MKNKIVAVELNIFNEKVKEKVLNAGGKGTSSSSMAISTVLKMTQKRVRIQQRTGYIIWELLQSCDCAVGVTGSSHACGYNLADYIYQATRVLACRSRKCGKGILLLTFSKLITDDIKRLQLHINKE